MKKSLIALAVLASVAGVAQAQSSVQLYGIVDLSMVKDKGVSAQMLSGAVSGSRWGLKGSEDLGGGLKANFLLEQGFAADAGTAGAGTAFSRQSYVGLSSGFGEVRFGKIWTAYDDISGATSPVFDSALSPNNAVWASTGYNANPANGFYYATPAMGGLSGAVSYALDEVAGNAISSTATAFHVKYEGGPVYAGFAYQAEDQGAATKKFTRLNGSYDLGVAKVLAGYGKVSLTGTPSVTDLSIGADVPLGSSVVLSAGYASSKASGGVKLSAFSVGAAYLLSKRTTVYGGYLDTKNVGPDSRIAVGLKHTF